MRQRQVDLWAVPCYLGLEGDPASKITTKHKQKQRLNCEHRNLLHLIMWSLLVFSFLLHLPGKHPIMSVLLAVRNQSSLHSGNVSIPVQKTNQALESLTVSVWKPMLCSPHSSCTVMPYIFTPFLGPSNFHPSTKWVLSQETQIQERTEFLDLVLWTCNTKGYNFLSQALQGHNADINMK